ncbi:MAG TPA: 3-phosphoshikimate 1-carboxyvinyltransferase [Candidatus Acidoferrum sp.]|jgi:3-phosphoshikimate 1-carboxyvinyltransferase|nr:3-phosphoshikimate 1-carboxyvinyltransferase [Candidatus Acidoferrum sp.]
MPLPALIEIVPLDKPVHAAITVPGSKSITNRALILAALADGETTLEGALWSEDTQVMVECLQELGFMVNVAPDPNELCNRTITVYGKGGAVPRGGTTEQPLELFVGNAGTAARFLAAFVCLGEGVYRLHGVQRMHERPQAELFAALRELGYQVEAEHLNEKLPVRILVSGSSGVRLRFPVRKDKPEGSGVQSCSVSIENSSQFASALLLCANAGRWNVHVVGENAEESPYVAMTTELIEVFPKKGGAFRIEPDASSGSYFLAADYLIPSDEHLEYSERFGIEVPTRSLQAVTVADWPSSDWQVDVKFLHNPVLHGLDLAFGLGETPEGRKEMQTGRRLGVWDGVKRGESISRKRDLGDSIMTAIVLAPLSIGSIQFTDLGRLRVQECERVVALRTELTRCGAKVIEEGDTLTVYPSELHGAEIETYDDHRMAMCFAILGLKVPGIKIKDPACVKKTFPNFFQKLATPPPKGLGVTIRDVRTGRALGLDELFAT